MDAVQEVEYTLDPSFPDPVRVSRDREHSYALQSEAWGSFLAHIRIFRRDGEIVRQGFRVGMEENAWPMGARLTAFDSTDEKVVYEALFDPQWEWRKRSTLARRAGLTIEQTDKALGKLESARAARKAYFQSIDHDDLWGVTCIVGLLPELGS
jgi:hypothetical protein